jgi:hypothetical protein
MHSLVHEHYVRAQVAERLAACEQGRKWRRWRQQPSQTPPPRPPGRGGGPFASGGGSAASRGSVPVPVGADSRESG